MDTGIYTAEGNVAGARAAQLTKEREKMKAEYDALKSSIKKANEKVSTSINDKFSSGNTASLLQPEEAPEVVGLQSIEEYEAGLLRQRLRKDNLVSRDEKLQKKLAQEKKLFREVERKQKSAVLSFNDNSDDDSDEDREVFQLKKKAKGNGEGDVKRISKDPNVETSFLPDRERELNLQKEKERLRAEWLAQQEIVKNEILEVVYSYWDGSGHRRAIKLKKGSTIGEFLTKVRDQLSSEFKEVANSNSEDFIYVKEDLIIPHSFSFYDLIITKARGKSGPLFHFDVHDDVRLMGDARVEKDESHPGKVVDRRWYDKNKHIFPASRWEIFDPTIKREDGYSIHDSKKNH
jgi:protein FAM50